MSSNRTITQTFEALGDDVYVTIKNPDFCTDAQLTPKTDISKIKDRGKQTEAADRWLASFVVDWHVYDTTDESDNPAVLGDPDEHTIALCSAKITRWIVAQVQAVSDPL